MSDSLIDLITADRKALAAVVDKDYPQGVHGRQYPIAYRDAQGRLRSGVANDCSSQRDKDEPPVQPAPDLSGGQRQRGGRPVGSQGQKAKKITRWVRKNGPASVADIAAATGLSRDFVGVVMRRSGGIGSYKNREKVWDLK